MLDFGFISSLSESSAHSMLRKSYATERIVNRNTVNLAIISHAAFRVSWSNHGYVACSLLFVFLVSEEEWQISRDLCSCWFGEEQRNAAATDKRRTIMVSVLILLAIIIIKRVLWSFSPDSSAIREFVCVRVSFTGVSRLMTALTYITTALTVDKV